MRTLIILVAFAFSIIHPVEVCAVEGEFFIVSAQYTPVTGGITCTERRVCFDPETILYIFLQLPKPIRAEHFLECLGPLVTCESYITESEICPTEYECTDIDSICKVEAKEYNVVSDVGNRLTFLVVKMNVNYCWSPINESTCLTQITRSLQLVGDIQYRFMDARDLAAFESIRNLLAKHMK